MQTSIIYQNSLKAYFEKQRAFRALVKSVQCSLQAKEYKETTYSFEDFIKMRWNISKAQAYRYVISAKVIDQLEEFDIQPCYERICRALYNCAKTPSQMKLLWSSILRTAGNRPDSINSSHVKKMWKKLCDDKKYNKICHYEDEIMSRIEKSLNEYSKDSKHKQLNSKKNEENRSKEDSFYPSPLLKVPVIPSNNNTNEMNQYYNTPTSQVEYQYLPVNTTSSQRQYYYPSPIQTTSVVSLSKNIPYTISSSPVSVCSSSSNLYDDSSVEQPLSSSAVTLPSINVIECPVYEVQVPSQQINTQKVNTQPVNTQCSKPLFPSYPEQPQYQPQPQTQYQTQMQLQPQVVYYY